MRDADGFAQDVLQDQADVFRLYVGQGRRISYGVLAEVTGIPIATLKSYATGTAMPLCNALRVIATLPPEAGNMLVERSGKRLVDIESDATNWDEIASETAGLTSDICAARADGRIDHAESARLRQRTRELIAKAQGAVG